MTAATLTAFGGIFAAAAAMAVLTMVFRVITFGLVTGCRECTLGSDASEARDFEALAALLFAVLTVDCTTLVALLIDAVAVFLALAAADLTALVALCFAAAVAFFASSLALGACTLTFGNLMFMSPTTFPAPGR